MRYQVQASKTQAGMRNGAFSVESVQTEGNQTRIVWKIDGCVDNWTAWVDNAQILDFDVIL